MKYPDAAERKADAGSVGKAHGGLSGIRLVEQPDDGAAGSRKFLAIQKAAIVKRNAVSVRKLHRFIFGDADRAAVDNVVQNLKTSVGNQFDAAFEGQETTFAAVQIKL